MAENGAAEVQLLEDDGDEEEFEGDRGLASSPADASRCCCVYWWIYALHPLQISLRILNRFI
jgi:hypothetical protein